MIGKKDIGTIVDAIKTKAVDVRLVDNPEDVNVVALRAELFFGYNFDVCIPLRGTDNRMYFRVIVESIDVIEDVMYRIDVRIQEASKLECK